MMRAKMWSWRVVLMAALSMAVTAHAQEGKSAVKLPFSVYTDQGDHFKPSGLMGDANDLYIVNGYSKNPGKGEACMKVTYSGQASQGNRWAGVYWQEPAGNWGSIKGAGFDLTGAKKLKFLARGEKGGEQIEFKCGGISGDHGDTFRAGTNITLTPEWKEYVIDLEGQDLSTVIGGFVFALNADKNPEGAVFYLDEIQYDSE